MADERQPGSGQPVPPAETPRPSQPNRPVEHPVRPIYNPIKPDWIDKGDHGGPRIPRDRLAPERKS